MSPPRRGGALYVFEDADLSAMRQALAALDLQKAEIFACNSRVVAFVPGVAEDGAARLEQALVARTKARTKERAVVPP